MDLLPDPARNEGIPLDLDWIENDLVNEGEVDRRLERVAGTRLSPRERREWLLRAVACIDLTTLADDDTPQTVGRLCLKAREPLSPGLKEVLGISRRRLQVAAVCVFDRFVRDAVLALEGTTIPVAGVTAGFPLCLMSLHERVAQVEACVASGAAEVDLVIPRSHVLGGAWKELYGEVAALRAACGGARLKAILATGELGTLSNVARASLVCMMAGADFIKTSTGREAVNATLPSGAVMASRIRHYRERTGFSVGLKPAGGIRRARQALDWLLLAKQELADPWTRPNLFRIGASTLLEDIERELLQPLFG